MITDKQGTEYRKIGITNPQIVQDLAVIIDRSNQAQRGHKTCASFIALYDHASACEEQRTSYMHKIVIPIMITTSDD
jgi:hypothetical protein